VVSDVMATGTIEAAAGFLNTFIIFNSNTQAYRKNVLKQTEATDFLVMKLTPDVHVGSLDSVEDELCDALTFNVDQVRLEQSLGSLEALTADLE
jgi:hypothetical protein